MIYALAIIVFFMLIYGPQLWVQRVLKHHNRLPEANFPGNGGELARHLLDRYDLQEVRVEITDSGDHYDPVARAVRLTRDKFEGKTLTAITVAAHECGHAVQHAQAYGWLQMRSTLVPIVSVTSGMSQWVIIGGLVLGAAAGVGLGYWGALAGLAMMGFATLFSFITLPVEYDASNRALAWLKNKHMVSQEEYKGSEDALKWAARTYLVAAIGALASLVYWAFQILGRD